MALKSGNKSKDYKLRCEFFMLLKFKRSSILFSGFFDGWTNK